MRIKLLVQGEIAEMQELYERLETTCGNYGVSLRDFVYMYYFDIHGPVRLPEPQTNRKTGNTTIIKEADSDEQSIR